MVAIREFEERLYTLFLTEAMPGTMHQYTGQEAVAAGVCAALEPSDYIASTHRGHGHAIAKGVSLRSMMAEMFARDTGCCRGMGGSMHLGDPAVGMLAATAIVGGGIPIATGAALSAKMRGTGQVAVAFFGDGASNEGSFHESLNQAGAWRLPAIYVCENNLYGFSVPFRAASAVSDVASRAAGYGFPGVIVDGNDVLAVHQAVRQAVQRARAGEGPTLIECKTYRHRGHSRFEKPVYRTDEELAEWMQRDPIPRFREFLMEEGVLTEGAFARMVEEVRAELDDAVAFARQSPEPPVDAALRYAYAGPSEQPSGAADRGM
ncbi:MAG: thiamine pyrophosphate-dependent dehydrogenase E1 component subunit alpha [Anaerolineales bacterium]|nr:thiamine pyrophosphate-dependent dehydrogenase E1 component subunit alpha [Anaerolineales bacterium]